MLHSGAEAQKAAWMGALAASTSWNAILMNAIVQPKAVMAWAATVAALADESGEHGVPPALLHNWLHWTLMSLDIVHSPEVEEEKRGGCAREGGGLAQLCMRLAQLRTRLQSCC